MKKSIFTIAMAFGLTAAFAQESSGGLMNKKGEPYLPETGDWGIVINANPILGYIGGFFSTAGGSASALNTWQTDNVITGKYFTTEKMAYRAKVRLGFNSATNKYIIDDDASTTTPPATTEDEVKTSTRNITLGGGLEWRKGKTRLQGFYGAEALIGMGGSLKTTYSYGNAFSSTNTSPTTYLGSVGSRTTESKAGGTFSFGVRGFVGAEYFIFPKMSLGLEYGWGIEFAKTGEGETQTESWNGTAVTNTTSKTGASSTFGIDTDNSGGMITLGFHF